MEREPKTDGRRHTREEKEGWLCFAMGKAVYICGADGGGGSSGGGDG